MNRYFSRLIVPTIVIILVYFILFYLFSLVISIIKILVAQSSNDLIDRSPSFNSLPLNLTTLLPSALANTNLSEQEKTLVGSGFIYFYTHNECQCSKRVIYPPPQQIINKLNSSCSDEGTFYQHNQKVISTCLHFNKNDEYSDARRIHSVWNYQPGLLQNLAMLRQHFPGYSLRIYSDLYLKANSSWCKLLCENDDLFWCDIRRTPSHGNLIKMDFRSWRFLPLGDPTVQIFLSRDLDSRLSYREGAVVQDWLEHVGNKAFQVLRDRKKWHNMTILGGLWGAQNTRLLVNDRGVKLREKIIKMSQMKKGYGVDQKMLEKLIFIQRARDVVAYDSYQCTQWWNKTEWRPFPVQRTGHPAWDFVGQIVDFRKLDLEAAEFKLTKGKRGEPCPVECRPDYGKDWVFC